MSEPDVSAADARPDPTVAIDARGLHCPMPVIELAKAMRRLPEGATVELLATDGTTRVDVPVWCRMQRQQLLEAEQFDEDGSATVHRFLVQRVGQL